MDDSEIARTLKVADSVLGILQGKEFQEAVVDGSKRSLPELRLKYDELTTLDDADTYIAGTYTGSLSAIDVLMSKKPEVVREILTSSIVELAMKEKISEHDIFQIIHKAVLLRHVLDEFGLGFVQSADAPEPRVKNPIPNIVPQLPDDAILPPHGERLAEFRNRMGLGSPKTLASEDDVDLNKVIDEHTPGTTEFDQRMLLEGLSPAELAQTFVTVAGQEKPVAGNEQTLYIPEDPDFFNIPRVGTEAIPDNPNRPRILRPDADEVKNYAAARSGPTGQDADDHGLEPGPISRPTKRRRPAPEERKKDLG